MIDYLNPEWVFVKIMIIMKFAIFNDTDLITVQHQFELIFNCFISNMPIYGNIMISKTLESCKYLVVHSFQFLQHSSALCP